MEEITSELHFWWRQRVVCGEDKLGRKYTALKTGAFWTPGINAKENSPLLPSTVTGQATSSENMVLNEGALSI